jgi:branched-chain amino acid transport system substrate-binding protein
MRKYFCLLNVVFVLSFWTLGGQASTAMIEFPVGVAGSFQDTSANSGSPTGDNVRRGIAVAIDQNRIRLKKAGKSIRLVEFNYKNEPLAAGDAARAAVASEVVALHGYDYSSHALVAAPISQEGKLPLFTPTATADRLAKMGAYVHQVAFNNSHQARMLARFAIQGLKKTQAYIVAAQDCAYCQDLGRAFEAEFTGLKGTVKQSPAVLSTDEDLSRVVADVKAANVDLVFIPNYEVFSARTTKALLDAGINVPFFGGDGWNIFSERLFKQLFKTSLANTKVEAYAIGHWHSGSKQKASRDFVRDFKIKYKTLPTDTSALAFDAMNVIIEAILRAKTPSRDSIEQEAQKLGKMVGATGTIDLSPDKSERSVFVYKLNVKGFEFHEDLGRKYSK